MMFRRNPRHLLAWAVLAAVVGCPRTGEAGALGRATVTQVNNDVRYTAGQTAERPAKPSDVVRGDDIVRTGLKSQAELEFEDKTITRLGSNSTFTFDPDKREFQLKKGLLLFDMPHHAGGGKIVTPAGTAAIEGTAGIISYRSAPKVICLAGEIRFHNVLITAGQMYILGITPKPVDVHLKGIEAGLLMRRGLPNNRGENERAKQQQQARLRSGDLEMTPFVMFGEGTDVLMREAKPLALSSFDAGRLEAWIYLLSIWESIFGYPKPPPVRLDGNDVIDHDRALIYTQSNDDLKVLGFLDSGTDQAKFVTGRRDIQITGSPQFIMGSGRPFNISLGCVGQIAVTGANLEFPGTLSSPFNVEFNSIAVDENPGLLIRDSVVGNSSLSALGGTFTVLSLTDMLVEQSQIIAYGGYPSLIGANLLDIKSSGITADGLYGGTVYLGAADVAINNSRITANTTDTSGLYGYGGFVAIDGSRSTYLGNNTDVQAQGPAYFQSINLRAEGKDDVPGHIQLEATTGYVRLNAQEALAVLGALPAGTIEITGNEYYDATEARMKKTAVLDASGNYGGGRIDLTASSLIQMTHAHLIADAAGSFAAGTIRLEAPSILINNSILSASSAAGAAGRIEIAGAMSGVVTINNSSLLATGASASSLSGIYITGGTVNIDSYTLSHINSGPAPTVITSHNAISGLPSTIRQNIVP